MKIGSKVKRLPKYCCIEFAGHENSVFIVTEIDDLLGEIRIKGNRINEVSWWDMRKFILASSNKAKPNWL